MTTLIRIAHCTHNNKGYATVTSGCWIQGNGYTTWFQTYQQLPDGTLLLMESDTFDSDPAAIQRWDDWVKNNAPTTPIGETA